MCIGVFLCQILEILAMRNMEFNNQILGKSICIEQSAGAVALNSLDLTCNLCLIEFNLCFGLLGGSPAACGRWPIYAHCIDCP